METKLAAVGCIETCGSEDNNCGTLPYYVFFHQLFQTLTVFLPQLTYLTSEKCSTNVSLLFAFSAQVNIFESLDATEKPSYFSTLTSKRD